MKFSVKHIFFAVTLSILSFSASAQTLNSLYFLDNPQSHLLNPALTSDKGWVTTPFTFSMGMNSNLGLEAFMRPYGNDEMITFLHPSISTEDAMSKFQNMNTMELDFSYNLLTVGFNAWGGTNSIGISAKFNGGMYLPKDLFRFLKAGQDADGETEYNLDNFGARAQAYTEIALGHARDINKKLTVGAKVKFILGMGYANANIDNMRVYMSDNKWQIEQQSSFTMSKGIDLMVDEDGDIDDLDYSFKMGGFGLGFDLGATYQLMDNLKLSLAVTDLGFINWSGATVHKNKATSFEYTGFDNFAAEDSKEFDDAAEEIGDKLEALVKYEKDASTKSKTTSLYTTFRAGAEYGLLKNKITLGLLISSRVGAPKNYTEGMLSVNFKPCNGFSAAVNGSVSNVKGSLGAVLTFGSCFIGADYILAKYSKQVIPVDAAKFNFAIGTAFKFGASRKKNFEAKDI